MSLQITRLALLAAAVGLTGCQCEKLFPEPVAMGAARLTVRNLGTLVSLAVADQRCGFASSQVQENAVYSGEVGREGTVTFKVESCVLDYGSLHLVATDCGGVETKVAGEVTFSGEQRIHGQITGNPENPVIPNAADAVEMEITAGFGGFEVRSSDADNGLMIEGGEVRFKAKPHLGVSAELGVCAVATKDLSLEEIIYTNAVLWVDAGDGAFEVEVPTSDLNAQVGKWGDRENDVWGQITVWDTRVDVPTADDTAGLDDKYDRANFLAGFACTEDLALPLSYECGSLDEKIAVGAAQLTVASFGQIVNAFDENTVCGFASDEQIDQQVVIGLMGRDGGSVRMEMNEPCTMNYPVESVLKTDCNNVRYLVKGQVSATGYKEVQGIRTGNRETPIVPTQTQPSEVEVTLTFQDFDLRRSDLPYSLLIKRGELSGLISVRLGKDTSLNACAIKSSAASLRDVRFRDAEVVLTYEGNQFAFTIDSTDLSAFNGRVADHENELTGTITIDGVETQVNPPDGPLPLDPNYDYETFLAADACKPDYQHVETDSDCSFYPTIGYASSRLAVSATAALALLVNGDSSCGFEDTISVLAWPDEVVGDSGEMGSITWSVEGCAVGEPEPTVLKENCFGTRTYYSGAAVIDSTRTITGLRNTQYLVVASIIPSDHREVQIVLDQAELNGFQTYDLGTGDSVPPMRITFHDGTISGMVEPILGERASEPGSFDVPTPIAIISDVVVLNAAVTMEVMGMTLVFDINEARITAQNGIFEGEGNYIEGSMVIDGVPVAIPHGVLDPEFDQNRFNQSYACADDLLATIDPD